MRLVLNSLHHNFSAASSRGKGMGAAQSVLPDILDSEQAVNDTGTLFASLKRFSAIPDPVLDQN